MNQIHLLYRHSLIVGFFPGVAFYGLLRESKNRNVDSEGWDENKKNRERQLFNKKPSAIQWSFLSFEQLGGSWAMMRAWRNLMRSWLPNIVPQPLFEPSGRSSKSFPQFFQYRGHSLVFDDKTSSTGTLFNQLSFTIFTAFHSQPSQFADFPRLPPIGNNLWMDNEQTMLFYLLFLVNIFRPWKGVDGGACRWGTTEHLVWCELWTQSGRGELLRNM